MKFSTIDLCAGIGGIRKGFELTGKFFNVLSAENDKYACMTYKHLFGDDPFNDIATEDFKKKVKDLKYDILMAGFPCQPFSRAGLKEGFSNDTKGTVFYHIASIIKISRPKAIFLENVDHLVTHQKGQTFKTIIHILEKELNYKIIGVNNNNKSGEITYNTRDFIRNSRYFGVPQNRPRTYIIGFDRKYFGEKVNKLNNELPKEGNYLQYKDIYDILDEDVPLRYYLSSGYYNTLIKHKEREKNKGNGFGFKIINDSLTEHPIANTLLATGGSGKERNLIIDIREGIAGKMVSSKKTGLNEDCIRMLTPNEWGKLQGFINYAFMNQHKDDTFSFPDDISDAQQYKQLGNSVTIPVIQVMADFILESFKMLGL